MTASGPRAGLAQELRALAGRAGPRACLGLLAAGAALAAFLPLADHLGYELAEGIALLAGSAGLATGVSAARRALGQTTKEVRGSDLGQAPKDPPDGAAVGRPSEQPPAVLVGQLTKDAPPAPGPALAAALAWNAAALAAPVALILLNGLRRPVCDPLAGLQLYLLLALPSGLLAAALGFACGALSPRRGGLLAAGLFAATLAQALWPILSGPQVFAFHHLGGMFPGPIYDEAIRPTAALLAFRACTLCWAAACAGLGLTALGRRRAGLLLLALGGPAALALSASAERLHWQASVAQLDRELGGTLAAEGLVLHFPREKTEAERRLLLADAAASAREVLEFLGTPGARPAKVDAFLFRSAEEKRRLIGAADTSFTKPWLRQIHTNDAPAPHPILRHELAHALAADAAGGPFGVPGRLGGLLPDMGFIEGLAVAADWPAGEATVDEETAALKKLGRLPDLAALFAPGRFYAEAGPSAYASAGSLIRMLWRLRGPEAVRRAYGDPRGLAALGPIDGLARAHAAFLDGVPVPEPVLALAALRFSQPAIVRRRCAHEVAELQRTAGQAAQRGEAAEAARLWARCAALEPDDPGLLLAERRSLAQAGDAAGALAAERAALAHPKLSRPQRAQLLGELGDAAWKRGEAAEAKARFDEAAALPQPEAATRALQARRYALADPIRWPAALRLLADGDAGPETWLLLRDLDLARPGEGFAPYLLAKQAQNRGAWATCLRFTAEARRRPLPGPLFEAEALRMQAACGARGGDPAAARQALEELLRDPSEARRLEAARALRRLPGAASLPAPALGD